jgi:hypothetical protein
VHDFGEKVNRCTMLVRDFFVQGLWNLSENA